MRIPGKDFYNGIELLYRFCKQNGFGILDITLMDGSNLYVYPIRSLNPKNYRIVCFADKTEAEKFEKYKNKLVKDHLGLNELLNKYNIGAITISYELEEDVDDIAAFVTGFGSLFSPLISTKFYDDVIKFLEHKRFIFNYLKEDVPKVLGLPEPMFHTLLEDAIQLYPELLESRTIVTYKNIIDGKIQGLTPVGELPGNQDDKMWTYIVLPDRKNIDDFKKQISVETNGEQVKIEVDGVFIDISKSNGHFRLEVEAFNKATDYSDERIHDILMGFLSEIEELWAEKNTKES